MATKRMNKKRYTKRRGGELPLRAKEIANQIQKEKEQENKIDAMSRSYNELREREGERAIIANDSNNKHKNNVQHSNKNGKPGLYGRFKRSLKRKWNRGSFFKKKDPFNETNEEREKRFKNELLNEKTNF